ncbi:hypothetical protein N5F13_14975 [Comamonas thiooxydans]|uniref:terminase small subunit-like protein n=1 Tax=Comamonas thiooxydans TaxID=363952 RepID=UPI002448CA6D|nr:hypothetical protein [Comamonas thiooxydans]MDH1475810.1 hypothetical protein [Comamonas thiooxydans]
MATSKHETNVTPDKASPDWEAIKLAYRSTLDSVRQIARAHNISHTAIAKKAAAEEWQRPGKTAALVAATGSRPSPTKKQRPAAAQPALIIPAQGSVIEHERATFSQGLCDAICTALAEGESLRSICLRSGMPHIATVMRWLSDPEKRDFCEQYTRAREAQAETLAEELLAIADEAEYEPIQDPNTGETLAVAFDKTAVARNKLRVETRKWLAARMSPKKYGDKLAVGGAADLDPIQMAGREMTDAERAVRLVNTLKAAPGAAAVLLGAALGGDEQ